MYRESDPNRGQEQTSGQQQVNQTDQGRQQPEPPPMKVTKGLGETQSQSKESVPEDNN